MQHPQTQGVPMKKIAAFATTTVLLAVAGNGAASAPEAEPTDAHGTSVSAGRARSATTEAGDDHRHRQGRHGDDNGTGVEPGDDNGTGVEPGDDNGTGVEPGDDNGTGVEPGDDNGTGVEPGDDNGTGVEPGDDNG